ncbi:hypothetical protein F5Y19DRAFT_491801 [Xylariaceae sp. FL1651]|nr:hypothetical protein F5Y19DRAFT_491801 [Xylariaceae sp. FL1651]
MNPTTELPTIKAEKWLRTKCPDPVDYPYSLAESIKYYTGLDRDLIWGPFYKRFRAVRREKADWVDFDLETIWKGIPSASQSRPGSIRQAFNWAFGINAPPTITPSRPSIQRNPPPNTNTQASVPIVSWQTEIQINADWSPTRIDFTQWYGRYKHPRDYDDAFYRNSYLVLYRTIHDFVEKWFGDDVFLDDWRVGEAGISPWEVPMTEQFIQYARVVAHEDRGYVNWEDILNDPAHRKWLCIGVLSQILERKIFNQLLFGATKEFQEELDRHDQHWVLQEGFIRKEGRRQIVRAAVSESLVPQDFWDAVDDLAGQTVLIFKPLYTLLCLCTGRSPGRDGPVFWQEVHTILAMAGYFQVCMSISPTIFHILSATPGARFQWDEESHADKQIYHDSRDFHESHNERWRALADPAVHHDRQKLDRLRQMGVGAGELAQYLPLPTTQDAYRVAGHHRRRGGKVMYAVFPKLTRYKGENIGEHFTPARPASSQAVEETGEGMRIVLLCKCLVVYYQGLVHAPPGRDDGVPLEAHTNQLEWNRAGVLPYRRRFWGAGGDPKVTLAWPLWPESVDIFWFWWWLGLVLSQGMLLAGVGGRHHQQPYDENEPAFMGLAQLLFFKSLDWLAMEAFVYICVRFFEIPFFEDRFGYAKMQVVLLGSLIAVDALIAMKVQEVRIFSSLCAPLIWFDRFLTDRLPSAMVASAGFLNKQADAYRLQDR